MSDKIKNQVLYDILDELREIKELLKKDKVKDMCIDCEESDEEGVCSSWSETCKFKAKSNTDESCYDLREDCVERDNPNCFSVNWGYRRT